MKQETVIKLAMNRENIFLTGSAGTGKTYTLNKIIKKLKYFGRIVAVTASTGISATHLNGTTIHSWAGIGIKDKLTIDDLYKLRHNNYTRRRITSAQVLIIDEISMLHDFRLDLIDEVCRFVREKPDDPFGGLQVILCGDFYQLPPVNKDPKTGNKNYCFNANNWRNNFKTCYLTKIYRQEKDLEFIDILNNIRTNSVTDNQKKTLDSLAENQNENAINLFCKNVNVDILNSTELSKIQKNHHICTMSSRGDPQFLIDNLMKNCLAPKTLILKIGAHVMFLTNDFNRDIVNGTMGEVVDFRDHTAYDKNNNVVGEYKDLPIVKIFKTGKEEIAIPHTWEHTEYDESKGRDVVKASITQVPLRLAFALTIHKSQGATFDYINLDLGDTFGHNMGYVALSRATSLSGIQLKKYNEMSLYVDPEIIEKDKEFQSESEKNDILAENFKNEPEKHNTGRCYDTKGEGLILV